MTAEARAAKERKQKVFVLVGGIVLLGLLAFQLPRIMSGAPSAAADTGTTETETISTPGPAPEATPSAPVHVVAVSSTTLRSFSEFSRKNPFVQQVDYDPAATGGGSGGSEAAAEQPDGGGSAPAEAVERDFSVESSPAAAVTVISVNGEREAVGVGTAFPARDPVFLLIAERPERKTAVVGVAGGTYANGSRTTTLKVGKPLVLVNTTTGARYRVVLVAVGSGAQPAAAEAPTP